MELVIIDTLVPEDHLLRKIKKHIDFSFINDMCREYYRLDNGRPAIGPASVFKMLFIGYLYGIRSERRLDTSRLGSLPIHGGVRLCNSVSRPDMLPVLGNSGNDCRRLNTHGSPFLLLFDNLGSIAQALQIQKSCMVFIFIGCVDWKRFQNNVC